MEQNRALHKIFSKHLDQMIDKVLIFIANFIKFDNPLNLELIHILQDPQDPLYNDNCLNNVKNTFFNLLIVIMNKFKHQKTIPFEKIDQLLQALTSLKIFTEKQEIKIKDEYVLICNHYKVDKEIIFDAKRDTKYSQILQDMKQIYDNTLKKAEFKLKENGIQMHPKEERKEAIETMNQSSKYEKEFCIICMAKTREVVFLPCKHFLTCDGCSLKSQDCPICFKKLDSRMKIFWS